ncbi:MAG: hypothetical protein JW940_32455 [Polyangiaceae bacterium]|nr:hypothetical protein [Polyangiaceae bacterium]
MAFLFGGLWLHQQAQDSFPKNERGWPQTPTRYSLPWTLAVSSIINGLLFLLSAIGGTKGAPNRADWIIFLLVYGGVSGFHYVAVSLNPRRREEREDEARRAESNAEEERRKQRQSEKARLRVLEPLFNLAYAARQSGDLTPEGQRHIAQRERDVYLARAAEIQKAYTDTNSPLWNEAKCRKAAEFLKVHATHNSRIGPSGAAKSPAASGVSASQGPFSRLLQAIGLRSRPLERWPGSSIERSGGMTVQAIADLLYAYHCHEWNILQHAKKESTPTEELVAANTPGDEYARERVAFRQGVDRARREILAAEKARIEVIESDEALSREEKDRLVAAIREDTQRDLETLERKSRRI